MNGGSGAAQWPELPLRGLREGLNARVACPGFYDIRYSRSELDVIALAMILIEIVGAWRSLR
jgi:hypothetical protein